MYSLSLDQGYLGQEKEVYVTYKDGILMEMQENKQFIRYRRKLMNTELLKRAVLQEYAKLIDQIVINQPLLGWEDKDYLPSHFFQTIHSSYQALYEENATYIDPLSSKHSRSGEKKDRMHQYSSTQYGMPRIAKNKGLSHQ